MDISIEHARFNMIQQQIRPWNLADERVLSAMAGIERERFVPQAYRNLAYADLQIPIAEGQIMLEPKLVARMLQALDIQADDKILEIGTGTGYATACLSRLGGRVLSMEIHADLAEQAREALAALQLRRVQVLEGDAFAAAVQGQPFDVIAVTGSLPDAVALAGLQEQLAPDGRLFAVVGEEPLMQALLVTRVGAGDLRRQALFETSIPALLKVPHRPRFQF